MQEKALFKGVYFLKSLEQSRPNSRWGAAGVDWEGK